MNRCQKYLWSAKPCQGRGTKQKSTMPVVHQLVENCR